MITAELVEVATGWQLWGESFDSESTDLLQIQDAITRQLLVNLKLTADGRGRETRHGALYGKPRSVSGLFGGPLPLESLHADGH